MGEERNSGKYAESLADVATLTSNPHVNPHTFTSIFTTDPDTFTYPSTTDDNFFMI